MKKEITNEQLKAKVEELGKRTKARTARRKMREYEGAALEAQNVAAKAAFNKAKAKQPLTLEPTITLTMRAVDADLILEALREGWENCSQLEESTWFDPFVAMARAMGRETEVTRG